ncbi:MAG: glycosyltransferase, partial [Deltaproteobacteria bacterium]|nr:glycosyltransferase [Deltaproteobacteria bacterium]
GWFKDEELATELGSTRVVRAGFPHWVPSAVERLRAAGKDVRRGKGASPGMGAALRVARVLRNQLAIPDERALWAAAAARRARALMKEQRYDVVWTSSFPYSAHLAGLWLRRRTGVPWVAELRDPWLDNPFRELPAWRRRIDARLEAEVLSAADAVVVVSPGMRAQITSRCAREKVHVISNGFDPEDFAGHVTEPARPVATLVYAGTFDAAVHPPDPILQALAVVLRRRPSARDDAVLRIVGGTDLESAARIRAWIALHRAGKMIEELGFVSHAQAVHHMRSADLLVLSVAEHAPWMLTSKVFEYLASERPILAAVPSGDCQELLAKLGGAAILPPYDSEALANVICAVAERRFSVEKAARPQEALAGYSHPSLVAALAAVFERVSA